MSSILSFDIISVVVLEPMSLRSWNLEPKNFVCISASVAYAAPVSSVFWIYLRYTLPKPKIEN